MRFPTRHALLLATVIFLAGGLASASQFKFTDGYCRHQMGSRCLV